MTLELIKIIAIAFFIPILLLSLWSWSLVFRRGFKIKIVKDKIRKIEYYKPLYYRNDYLDGMDYWQALFICVNEEKNEENKNF